MEWNGIGFVKSSYCDVMSYRPRVIKNCAFILAYTLWLFLVLVPVKQVAIGELPYGEAGITKT